MEEGSPTRAVAHLHLLLLEVALVEQVRVEEGHLLAVPVLVVLVVDHLVVQLLALDEAAVDRPQLLDDDLLLNDDLGNGGEEEEADQHQLEHDIPQTLLRPGIAVYGGLAAHVGRQQDAHGEHVAQHDADEVADLVEPQQRHHVEGVEDLNDDHDDACDLGGLELQDEGDDDDPSGEQGDEHVVLGVPLLAGHLLQEHVVVRVVHLETLPVAAHRQPDQHHHDLDQRQDGQHEREHLQRGLGADRADLDEAGEEEDVEDEGDDPGGEDYFFAPDEDGGGVVGDAVGEDQQHPEDAQQGHHDDELAAEGVREAVVLHNGQVRALQGQRPPLEPVPPRHQRGQLDVLEDVAVDPLPHGQHEEVQAGDDDRDDDEGHEFVLRGGAAEDEDVAVVGQAGGAGVGIVGESAAAALAGAVAAAGEQQQQSENNNPEHHYQFHRPIRTLSQYNHVTPQKNYLRSLPQHPTTHTRTVPNPLLPFLPTPQTRLPRRTPLPTTPQQIAQEGHHRAEVRGESVRVRTRPPSEQEGVHRQRTA